MMRSVKGPTIDERDPEEDKKTEIYDPTIDPPAPSAPTPSPKSPPQLPLTPPSGSPPQPPPPPPPRPKTPTSKGRAEPPGASSQPAQIQRARTSRASIPPALPGPPKSSPAVPVDTPPQGVPVIQATSMKAPEDAIIAKPKQPQRREIPQVKLRPIGSIDSGAIQAPKGRLAPPQDEREARRQRLWSNTFWASIAVIIASLVALAIWLIAGKK